MPLAKFVSSMPSGQFSIFVAAIVVSFAYLGLLAYIVVKKIKEHFKNGGG